MDTPRFSFLFLHTSSFNFLRVIESCSTKELLFVWDFVEIENFSAVGNIEKLQTSDRREDYQKFDIIVTLM